MNPIDVACKLLHDSYEAAAKMTGWETKESTKVEWEDLPEANKETMRIAVSNLYNYWFGPI